MGRILHKGLVLLSILLLGGIGIALGLFMGKEIGEDEWPLLVTASGLATYIALALIDARHALLFWVVTAPFARFVYLELDLGRGIPNLTLNRIMTAVLVILVLAQLATRRRKLARISVADVSLLAYGAVAGLSVSNAVVGLKSAAQSFFNIVIIPIAIYFLARNLITSRRELKGVMHSLVIIGLYLAVLAIREQLTGQVLFYPEDRSVVYTASIRRVVGLLGNPAYIAVTVGMIIPWAWYLFLNAHRRRLMWLIIIGTMMLGVYLCMNRSGWAGLAFSLLIMALFVKRFRYIFLIMVLVGVVLVGVYWALITSSAVVQERLTAEGPIEYREAAWSVALRMIKDYPVFGVGFDNYRYYYQRYAQWDIYLRATPTPHNTFLWIILMGGFVAIVPFFIFLCMVALRALSLCVKPGADDQARTHAELAGVFLASMSAYWVPAQAMDALGGYYNTMVMFFIIGAFYGAISGERGRLARGLRATSVERA